MAKPKLTNLGCVLAHKRAEQLRHVQNDEANAAMLVRVGLFNDKQIKNYFKQLNLIKIHWQKTSKSKTSENTNLLQGTHFQQL